MSGSRINGIGAQIPQPQLPFLDASGSPAREWLYYMIAILNRTGGNTGISSADLQKQIESLFVEEAMNDVQFPASGNLSVADIMTDDPQPASFPIMLGFAFSDDPAPVPINPFLASLLVADLT
jgi:hypothetical protein